MITSTLITPAESNLLQAIYKLGYGELLEVQLDIEEPGLSAELDFQEVRLIEIIRSGKQYLKRIVVHDRLPVSVEVTGTIAGYQTIQKIRCDR